MSRSTKSKREEVNKKVLESAEETGSWDDLVKITKATEEVPVVFDGKSHKVKYSMCTWEKQNQITKAIMHELGPNASRWEYERLKQEKMLRAMVLEIDGVQMNEANWLTIPFTFGEYLRMAFFMDTGEYADQLKNQNVSADAIKEILSQLRDGLVTQQESELKN